MAYVDLWALRQYLNQVNKLTPGDASANDALLEAILARAQSIVDGALGFTYAGYSTAARRSVLVYGGTYLPLPPYRLGSITGVAWGSTAYTLYTPSATPPTYQQYTITPEGNLYSPYGWGCDAGGWIDVTAEWGYGEPPESINQLILELSVNIWRSKDKGLFTEVIGADGAGALRYVGGLNTIQQMIIENVRAKIPGLYGI